VTHKRVQFAWHSRSINRPIPMVLVDGDNDCVLALHYGNGNSDPLLAVDLILSGTRIGRAVNRLYWWARELYWQVRVRRSR